MKEQQNIKECPRIHCSAQCEDNLALMENLDQRPGLHNCTFPNKHCAIGWARPPDSLGLFLCTDTASPIPFTSLCSLSQCLANRLEKCFHSKSAHNFSVNVKILTKAEPNGTNSFFPFLQEVSLSCYAMLDSWSKRLIRLILRCILHSLISTELWVAMCNCNQ